MSLDFIMISVQYINVSIIHYDVIMLGRHNYIPLHYANVIKLNAQFMY